MASLLSAKQISALLKTKRKQYVESVVGLGHSVVLPAGARAGDGAVGVLTKRRPTVLVFTIKSMPNRATLAARKTFKEVAGMQLRKVPNGVVKAAARNSPFELMMSGPTLIATPLPGKSYTLAELIDLARALQGNDKINKGLLFTGMVHHDLFLTPQRMDLVDFEAPKKLPSIVAQPAVGILQAIMGGPRLPILCTLQAWNKKRENEGAATAGGAATPAAPAVGATAAADAAATPAAAAKA